jgi:hypothetical protein
VTRTWIFVSTISGSDLGPAGNILLFACQMVVNPAAHNEQADELTGVEGVPTLKRGMRRARAGPPAEAVRLVVVAGAVAV